MCVVGLLDSWVAPPVETARSQVDQNPRVLVPPVKQAQKSPHRWGLVLTSPIMRIRQCPLSCEPRVLTRNLTRRPHQ